MNDNELRHEFFKIKNEEYLKKNPGRKDIEKDLIPLVEINPNQKQAFLYTRCSTNFQVVDGYSLDQQDAQLTDYCNNHNIQIIQKFQDAGISGGDIVNRPGLNQMLNSLRPGYFVICSNVSRLSRSTEQLLSINKQIKAKKAELILMDLDMDTSTPSGKLMLTVIASLATFEKDQISERVTKTMNHLSAQGLLIKKPHYGWTRKPGGELEPKKIEQIVIEKIKNMIKKQPTININQITKNLNSEGYTNRKDKPFHASTVLSIIRNNEIPLKSIEKNKTDVKKIDIKIPEPILNYNQQFYNQTYNTQTPYINPFTPNNPFTSNNNPFTTNNQMITNNQMTTNNHMLSNNPFALNNPFISNKIVTPINNIEKINDI
jgi:DNA invertase Pin-like site-specific DNA recombinase